MDKIKIITKDLGEFTQNGRITSLSGRPKGEQIRVKWNLDNLEKQPDIIVYINIPEYLDNIGRSLIQGIFTQTLQTIGVNGFYAKYKFSPHPIITNDIKNVIDGLASNLGASNV